MAVFLLSLLPCRKQQWQWHMSSAVMVLSSTTVSWSAQPCFLYSRPSPSWGSLETLQQGRFKMGRPSAAGYAKDRNVHSVWDPGCSLWRSTPSWVCGRQRLPMWEMAALDAGSLA